MNPYLEKLKTYIKSNPPNFGEVESVLTMLYKCYNENNPYDNEQIRADFHDLYRQMNGMPLCGRWIRSYTRFAGTAGVMKRQDSLRESAWVFSWRRKSVGWIYE